LWSSLATHARDPYLTSLVPPTYSTADMVQLDMFAHRKRLPRHRRVTNPPRMRLTARDMAVVLAVRDYRVLRRDQIQRLLFPSQNTANYRLQLLFQHGFLERRWRPVEYGQNPGQAIYLLGKRGADLLAKSIAVPSEIVARQGVSNTVHSPFLQHALSVSDVRVAFTIGAQRAGYCIERWIREDGLKAAGDYVYTSYNTETPRQVAIIPDAYLALRLGDRRAHFLLEVDRATETSGRWAHRVQAYLTYIASGRYSRRFGTTSLRILTITTSRERLTNLQRATEEAGGGSLFWFTTLGLVQPETVLSEPIWQVAGQEGMNKLIAGSSRRWKTGELKVPSQNP